MYMVGKSIWVIAVVLCLVCMSATPSAQAQAVYGSITGGVTDAQGSGVAGAKVVVTNVTKGTTEETTTNESGNYTVTHLIPDSYRIRIEAPGFKAYEIANVGVSADIQSEFHDISIVVAGRADPRLGTRRQRKPSGFATDFDERPALRWDGF